MSEQRASPKSPGLTVRLSSNEGIAAIASPAILFILWEIGARTGVLDARILPPPSVVIETIWEMFRKDRLAQETGITVLRFLVGLIVGVVPGTLIGLSMGLFRPIHLALNPLVAILYPIPRIALFPLVLILVGFNETSNLIMIAIGPFFTMLITAVAAVLSVDPIYRNVARNFGVRPRHLYFKVILPATMPALMGGLRVSLGLTLLGTVAVEFLTSVGGLGGVIWNSWNVMSLKQSMAGLVISAIVGAVFYLSMDWLERWLTPWQQPSSKKK